MDQNRSTNSYGCEGLESVPVLKWTDPCGITRTRSMEKFANGTAGSSSRNLMQRGRPRLIREILPALAHRAHDLSVGSVKGQISQLSRFFHFLDTFEMGAFSSEETPPPDSGGSTAADSRRINGLNDLPQHAWLLYAAHLKHSGISCEVASRTFAYAKEVIEEACRMGGFEKPDYYEPLFGHGSEGAPAQLHADLDYPALRFLLKSCRRLLKERQNAPLLRHLSCIRLDPDSSRAEADLGTCEGALTHVFAATLDSLAGGGRIDAGGFDKTLGKYRRRAAASGIADQSLTEYRNVVGPGKLEVLAAFILVMARTGWTDALRNLDIAGVWAVPQTEFVRNGNHYQIRSLRPKTGRVQTFSCNDRHWSPYSIVRRMIDRTSTVRSLAAKHCEILQAAIANGEADTDDRLELARLEAVARSPFAYFIPRLTATRGLRRLFEDGMAGYREELESLIEASPLAAAPEVRRSAARIRLTDFRHASAVRVLNSTGSLLAVQEHLAHQSLRTTERYVNQPRVRLEAYAKFARMMGFVSEEVMDGRDPDPRILYMRLLSDRTADLDPRMRRLLEEAGTVKRSPGIYCADPHDPPTIGRRAKTCPYDLCVICKNGIIAHNSPGAFEALAGRFGQLTHAMERMSPDSVAGSMEEFQHGALAYIRDVHYPDRTAQFNGLAEARRMELALREADND